MCLRSMLNPSFLSTSTSDRKAASDGGVSSPSGHQPWSSGPNWNTGLLFSNIRVTPLSSGPTLVLR